MVSEWLNIEVAYAKPEAQIILSLQVRAGSCLEEAIRQSGILERFPEIDLAQQAVGVFSQIKALGARVEEGDRIEIYRPLLVDPKEARRLRARRASKGRFSKPPPAVSTPKPHS